MAMTLLPGQLRKGRHHFLSIGDDGEVGPFHHVGVKVGVDCDHALAALDPLQVLRRSGNAKGEIAARLDQAARGADLARARQMAGIAGNAAAAFGGAKRGRCVVEGGPIGDAVAGADDEIGLGERHGIGIGRGEPAVDDPGRLRG